MNDIARCIRFKATIALVLGTEKGDTAAKADRCQMYFVHFHKKKNKRLFKYYLCLKNAIELIYIGLPKVVICKGFIIYTNA